MIKIEDLNGEQKEVANTIGIDAYLKLVKTFGGDSIYLAKQETIDNLHRDMKIVEEFNGDYTKLAKKYNLTVRTIRKIIKKHLKTNQNQLTWDDL